MLTNAFLASSRGAVINRKSLLLVILAATVKVPGQCREKAATDLMILELAQLTIGNGTCEEFEAAFSKATPLIASFPGYLSHELRRCLEASNRYVLLVKWETIEAHTVGFRQSEQYKRWRDLLHHFYEPFPVVEHYGSPILEEFKHIPD